MSLQLAQSGSESFYCVSRILNDPFRLRHSPDYPGFIELFSKYIRAGNFSHKTLNPAI